MVVHSGAVGLFLILLKGVGAHGDNRNGGFFGVGQGANAARRFQAVHARHLQIHENQVIGRRRGLHFLHGDGAVLRRVNRCVAHLQQRHRDFPVDGVILRKQNAESRQTFPARVGAAFAQTLHVFL